VDLYVDFNVSEKLTASFFGAEITLVAKGSKQL
jgi:hypothetical protein